jgi:hypothetical protein
VAPTLSAWLCSAATSASVAPGGFSGTHGCRAQARAGQIVADLRRRAERHGIDCGAAGQQFVEAGEMRHAIDAPDRAG